MIHDNTSFKLLLLELYLSIIEKTDSFDFHDAILDEDLAQKHYMNLVEKKISKNVRLTGKLIIKFRVFMKNLVFF